MRGSIIDGLTEKQAWMVYDYVMQHTRYLPEKPTLRRHANGSEDFSIRIPGAGDRVHEALHLWIDGLHAAPQLEENDR